MEYLTTKILYPHPNWKHVTLLHSKRLLAVLALHFIELNEMKRAPVPSLKIERNDMFPVRVAIQDFSC